MYRFFVEQSDINTDNGVCLIRGTDVNHIVNVLRMRQGERILLSTGLKEDPVEYLCEIDEIRSDEVRARILDLQKNARELPLDLYLFQALPKGDRFETVIEKSVELGVHEIIPVMSARCIVKLDEKRAEKKTARWNALSLSAAKQSKRSFVPVVENPVSWQGALDAARDMDLILVPYESAQGMDHTRDVITGVKSRKLRTEGSDKADPEQTAQASKEQPDTVRKCESEGRSSFDYGIGNRPDRIRYKQKYTDERRAARSGICIGPEGGFEDREIRQLQEMGAEVITLGHRILRTDTAGICVLSMLMLYLEED